MSNQNDENPLQHIYDDDADSLRRFFDENPPGRIHAKFRVPEQSPSNVNELGILAYDALMSSPQSVSVIEYADPLEYALFRPNPNVRIVKFLLERGARWNRRFMDWYPNAFAVAVDKDSLELAELFLESYEADPNVVFNYKLALSNAKSVDMVRLLLKHGANVDSKDEFSVTPIFDARNPEIFQTLLDAGANVDLKDSFGHDLLTHVASRNLSLVPYLVEKVGLRSNRVETLFRNFGAQLPAISTFTPRNVRLEKRWQGFRALTSLLDAGMCPEESALLPSMRYVEHEMFLARRLRRLPEVSSTSPDLPQIITQEEADDREAVRRMNRLELIMTITAANQVRRVGVRSQFRKVPKELIRKIFDEFFH